LPQHDKTPTLYSTLITGRYEKVTTLTQTITSELLDAVDDDGALKAVLQRHSRSKGPLYHALAQATSQLHHRLDKARTDLSGTETQRKRIEDRVQALAQQCEELDARRQALEQQVSQSESRLCETKELLDRAEALAGLGFGLDQLTRLHELLAHIAASQGATPEEGVRQFFDTVGHYEHIVSLDLESKRAESRAAQAKAEMERWEAEARRRESQSKARISAIDTVERWLSRGVREKDLPQWNTIIEKAGVSAESLASDLKRFSSLEALCRQRDRQAEELCKQQEQAEARLRTLKREEGQVKAGITSFRDPALREMEKVSQQAQTNLSELVSKARAYAHLQREAAQLENEIALARAFKSAMAEDWAQVPLQMVQQLLMGLIRWAGSSDHNQQVPAPSLIVQKAPGLGWSSLSVTDLLLWALMGVVTNEERKLLNGRR